MVQLVNWSTSESKEECIRESHTHLFSKATLLGTMSLIAHEDNIAAIREFLANISKFEDSGNEDFSLVLFKEVNKRFFAIGPGQVGNIHIVKVGRDLGLKIQTVIYNDHRRGLQFRLHAELLCGKDHE